MAGVKNTVDSGLLIITLPKAGVLTIPLLEDLINVIEAAANNDEIRILLFRSEGEVFCKGMGFNAFLEGKKSGNGSEGKASGLYAQLLKDIHQFPKPTVALVEGACSAGGVGIAVAADCIIATSNATFELGEALFGLIPANVIPYLVQRIPYQKVRFLIFTITRVDAKEAFRIGLADVAPEEGKEEAAVKRILKNLMRISPKSVPETKAILAQIANMSFNDQINLAEKTLERLMLNAETLEGIKSFSAGDIPPWFFRFRPSTPITNQQR